MLGGDVAGRAEALQRDLLEHLGLVVRGDRLRHVRVDEAGRHEVRGHAATRQLVGSKTPIAVHTQAPEMASNKSQYSIPGWKTHHFEIPFSKFRL